MTFYYWAYFLALSLTRLTGTTGVFLSKRAAADLSTLAGGGINPGPWIIECQATTSVGSRNVELRRSSRTRLHELIWYQLFKTVAECVKETAAEQRDPAEDRLYEAIRRSSGIAGDCWPSDLRNVVNYHPGAAYGAVRGTIGNEAFGAIAIENAPDFETLLGALEAAVIGLPRDVEGNITAATKALINLTFVLDAITRSLYAEVVERRKIDRRWLNARLAFGRSHGAHCAGHDWPVAL